jgi:hypothetical protein
MRETVRRLQLLEQEKAVIVGGNAIRLLGRRGRR